MKRLASLVVLTCIFFFSFSAAAFNCVTGAEQLLEDATATVMTAQEEVLLDIVKDLFPIAVDWRLAFEDAEEAGMRLDFHEFITHNLLNASPSMLQRAKPEVRSLINRIQSLVTAFGADDVKNRLIKFLIKEGDNLAGSPAQVDGAMGRLRLNLIKADGDSKRYLYNNADDAELLPTKGKWYRSRAFGPNGLERIPDSQINPLRREDHRVMGHPEPEK